MDNSENKNKGNYFIDFAGGTFTKALWVCFLWIAICIQLSYCTYKEVIRIINHSEIENTMSDLRDYKLRKVRVVGIGTDTYYDIVKGKYKPVTDKYVTIHDIKLNRDFKLPPNRLDVTKENKGKIIKINISEVDLVGRDNVVYPFAASAWEIPITIGLIFAYFIGIYYVAPDDFDNKMYKKYKNDDWKSTCDIYDKLTMFPLFWTLVITALSLGHIICFW